MNGNDITDALAAIIACVLISVAVAFIIWRFMGTP